MLPEGKADAVFGAQSRPHSWFPSQAPPPPHLGLILSGAGDGRRLMKTSVRFPVGPSRL